MSLWTVLRDAWRWVKGEPPPLAGLQEFEPEPVRQWLAREERASRDYLENVLVYRRERGR